MTRKRGGRDQEDSLDLLLDTVSNVFGGVMFLTLLAALLIISRGATATTETPVPEPTVKTPVSTTLIEAETRRTAVALASQKMAQQRLDPNGGLSKKIAKLEKTQSTLALAKRHARRSERSLESQNQAQADQQAAESDLEAQIQELQNEVVREKHAASKIRSASERTVEFRALSRSMTREAVIVLRYGRWYTLQTGKSFKSLNRDDFFILKDGEVSRMTPKPHKGHPVNQRSLGELKEFLATVFSS